MQNAEEPMVLTDRYFERNITIGYVMNRNYGALYQDTEYPIRHRRNKIALLMGAEGHDIAEERIRGFRDKLQAHGLPWREECFIQNCWRTKAGIRYAPRFPGLPGPPAAIIVGNNTLTTGVLEAVRNHRIASGGDVSMIGPEECDEDVQVFTHHGITSFRPGVPAVAGYAIELLLDRMGQSGERTGTRVEALELDFIERTSVYAPSL